MKKDAVGMKITLEKKIVTVTIILQDLTCFVTEFKTMSISKINNKGRYLLFEDTTNKKKHFKLELNDLIDDEYIKSFVLNIMK